MRARRKGTWGLKMKRDRRGSEDKKRMWVGGEGIGGRGKRRLWREG